MFWGHDLGDDSGHFVTLCAIKRSLVPPSGSEWVDPEDPTVIAETELLGAAASIEAAAKKLEQLKPRAKPKVGVRQRELSAERRGRQQTVLTLCLCSPSERLVKN